MAYDQFEEETEIDALEIIKTELADLATQYPFLQVADTDQLYIAAAISDGDAKLDSLRPFIESYVFLRTRGYNGQVSYLYVFMADTPLRPVHLNYSASGSVLIEGSPAYKVEYASQWARLDIATLWSPAIALRELGGIAQNGQPDKVRMEASFLCNCVRAQYSLNDNPRTCNAVRFKRKALQPIRH